MRYALLAISCLFLFPLSANALAYYVDFTVGIANGDGLATTTPFNNLDSFTEVARSAGDIAFVRRGQASTTNVTDLNFTSDGTIANPIIISADYDNLWNDFATSSQTYTVAIATSTFYASASITGIAAGDWVYVEGDCAETYNSTSLNQCEFAYEVASVSGTALNLYLPYKGNQSGSGKNLRVMPDNPQWNVASGDFQWNFDTDDYWLVKGLDIRSTDLNGVEIDSSTGHLFADTIFTTDSVSTGAAVTITDDDVNVVLKKYRVSGDRGFVGYTAVDIFGQIIIKDSIATLVNSASQYCIGSGGPVAGAGHFNIYVYDTVCRNTVGDLLEPVGNAGLFFSRNLSLKSSTEIVSATSPFSALFFEDYDGTLGDNRQNTVGAGTDTNLSLLLSTSTVRSGGGPTATEVRPTSNTTSIWDFNKIKLFEYPIYANTSSKQYDVYFRDATSTTQFTTDPTASELWIQCEYWAHDTGATSTRKVKKSTGTIDFNGSIAWQALSVTCQPTQSGILYLSGWYAKTKEAGASNIFLIDNTPIIQ